MSDIATLQAARPVREVQIKEMAIGCNTWDVKLEAGIKVETCMVPGFWANFAVKARVHDMVNVRTEDLAWRALFTVVSVGDKWVKLAPMVVTDLSDYTMAKQKVISAFFTKQRGPKKWCVLRNDTNEVMAEGLNTEKEAFEALRKIESAEIKAA